MFRKEKQNGQGMSNLKKKTARLFDKTANCLPTFVISVAMKFTIRDNKGCGMNSYNGDGPALVQDVEITWKFTAVDVFELDTLKANS